MNTERAAYVLAVLTLAALLCGCGGGSPTGSSVAYGRIAGSVSNLASGGGGPVTLSLEGTNLSTVAGSDGRFVLEQAPAGLHTLVAVDQGGWKAAGVVVSVEGGAETRVGELVLREAGQISGLVTSEATGEPISGVCVTVIEDVVISHDQSPHPVRVRYTDSNGSYTISCLPAGQYVVTIDKEGYESASLFVLVEPRATTIGDASLVPTTSAGAGAMKGTVYLQGDDGTRRPLAGVLVRLAKADNPGILEPLPLISRDAANRGRRSKGGSADSVIYPPPIRRDYYTFTDANGAYLLENVPAGEYVAAAIRPGIEVSERNVTIAADTIITVDFTLTMREPRLGTVVGTVTDAVTGQPIAGAEVYALLDIVPPGAPWAGERSGARNSSGGMVICPVPDPTFMSTVTDANGKYKLLVPETVGTIGFYADGYQPREEPVEVMPGGSVTVDVALQPCNEETEEGTISRR